MENKISSNLKIDPFKFAGILFAAAFAFRLFLIFVVTRPEYTGWYGDSYHHWQIAYYTLHIGLKQNPPRMWDLNGMEYYWGLLPTLVEAFLLGLFNTASILPFQIFNSMVGSLSTCLVFFISKRYFSEQTGVIAAILVGFNPITASTDISGMYESLGIFLLLLAVFFYDRKPFFCGALLGLAVMCRIEYYALSAIIIACYLIFERSDAKFVPGISGLLTSSVPFFIFLQISTGDWLYQLRWNVFSAAGGWDPRYTMPQYQAMLVIPRLISLTLLILSIVCLVYLFRKRPQGYIFPALFLFYSAFQFTIFTLSSYLAIIIFTPAVMFLVDRMFALNYIFISWVLAMCLEGFPFSYDQSRDITRLEALKEEYFSGQINQEEYDHRMEKLRSKLTSKEKSYGQRAFSNFKLAKLKIWSPKFVRVLKLALFIALILGYASSSSWVFNQYNRGLSGYYSTVELSSSIVSQYRGGTIISGSVFFNYQLINKGIPYSKIIGSLYSPLYYGVSDPKACLLWLKNLNVTWVFFDNRIREAFPFLHDEGAPPFDVVIPNLLYQVNQTELSSILATM